MKENDSVKKIYHAFAMLFIIGVAFIFLFRNPTGYVIEENCIDNDNDGYGSANNFLCEFPNVDCDDNNPTINPSKEEICADNVDNNCDGNSCLWRKCTDNDGENINIKGNTITEVFNKDIIRNTGSGQKNEFSDECKDSQILIEGTCNGESAEFKEILCKGLCIDGICV